MLLNKKEPAFAGSFGDVQLQNVIEYLQFVMINSPDDAGTLGFRCALARRGAAARHHRNEPVVARVRWVPGPLPRFRPCGGSGHQAHPDADALAAQVRAALAATAAAIAAANASLDVARDALLPAARNAALGGTPADEALPLRAASSRPDANARGSQAKAGLPNAHAEVL